MPTKVRELQAVEAEYSNYMNGKSADGTVNKEIRLYTKWYGSDVADESSKNKYVEFRIIQVGAHDGDGSAVTFMATHSLPTAQQMNLDKDNAGSWADSLMRTTTMSTYVKAGLSDLCTSDESTGAKTINKVTTSGKYTSWTEGSTTPDQFWLLSLTEIFGTDGNTVVPSRFNVEGTQYAWFANKGVNAKSGWSTTNTSIANMNLTRAGGNPTGCDYTYWWLRSPAVFYTYLFGSVRSTGSPIETEADLSRGVVPAFCF